MRTIKLDELFAQTINELEAAANLASCNGAELSEADLRYISECIDDVDLNLEHIREWIGFGKI